MASLGSVVFISSITFSMETLLVGRSGGVAHACCTWRYSSIQPWRLALGCGAGYSSAAAKCQLDVGNDSYGGAVILPDDLFCRIDLDQRLTRLRQRIASSALLVQTRADGQYQIRPGHRLLRVVVGATQVAQVVRMIVGKGRQTAIRGDDRYLEFFGEGDECLPPRRTRCPTRR